jgi:phage shock protein A
MTERMVHKATDDLAPEAVRVMVNGFRGKLTAAAIAGRLAEIDVEVPERTIARRAQEWRALEARRTAAREQMTAMVEAMKEGNHTASEMIQALATDALINDPDAFSGADPLKVQSQNLRAEELRLKREEMELRRKAQELDEKKFTALQEKSVRALAETVELEKRAESGETITPDQLRRIRDIYGLKV